MRGNNLSHFHIVSFSSAGSTDKLIVLSLKTRERAMRALCDMATLSGEPVDTESSSFLSSTDRIFTIGEVVSDKCRHGEAIALF
jgi:hypothetical protein